MGQTEARSQNVASRVTPEQRERIEREAQKRDRSISYIVHELIKEGLEEREDESS
jgi:predicted DNA-binding protein